MAVVESEQSPCVPSFSEDDDTQIRESDVEICVASFEVDDDTMIIGFQATDRKPADRQIIEERDARAPAETLSE